MAEQIVKNTAFEYKATASLVLQVDRSLIPRRGDEPTGEPETLAGRIDPKSMGDRAIRSKPKQTAENIEREKKRQDKKKEKKDQLKRSFADDDVFEGLLYRPKTKESKSAYELILNFILSLLGDQPQDILRGAADEALAILKNEKMKDVDRKKEIEKLLDVGMSSEKYTQLVNLGKKITDYSATNNEKQTESIDEEMGVAVVFDDSEEEQDETVMVKEDSENEEEGTEADSATILTQEGISAVGIEQKNDMHVPVNEIDAFWIQRQVSKYYDDAVTSQKNAKAVMEILNLAKDDRECENKLVMLLDYDKFDLVKLITKNRLSIRYCTLLGQAQTTEERVKIEDEMKQDPALLPILKSYTKEKETKAPTGKKKLAKDVESMEIDSAPVTSTAPAASLIPKQTLDLEAMAFHQGGHFMSNKKFTLPEGSVRRQKNGYEEVFIPPTKTPAHSDPLIPILSLPEWAQAAFPKVQTLNRVQSKLYPTAFQSDDNLLLCAPTGAGKTNVALLTILRELSNNRNNDGTFNLDAFKIVYIAPMKALVQEIVGTFSGRLKPFGVKVEELTGDRQLTKTAIAETQIIITTPEKWDIITRKSSDQSYTQLVRLIIIDEIHLLHDERGPVLEAIIARTIRNIEQTQQMVRLVGLSATLPNYKDVATFMRVDHKKGLFYFDASFRPCPLQQQYIGITAKKPLKRFQIANEITYEKLMDYAGKEQVIIFVHSRKETIKTAKALRDMCIEKETINRFLQNEPGSREVLKTESESPEMKNLDLKDILPYGFGIHHAGMTRYDRGIVEDLFAGGHLKVLVSTSTLAWGVNLPAHAVIIKGTQIYNPEKGRWVELSPQDVMQMIGRAGRPSFDTFGEGIIITTHTELQFYLSLLNQQLPIESQLISRLADTLNAEIVQGTIQNRDEAVVYLGYTYLYIRMLRAPTIYGIPVDDLDDDPLLSQRRTDLIHTAANLLEKSQLIKYDKKTGKFQSTELGRIASHYYISHSTMSTYNNHLKPTMSEIDLFRVFSLSDEFKYIPVREEEKLEIQKLIEKVPVPIKEGMEEPSAKVNVLLQAYISKLKLEGFALVADMVYVTQSAGRLIRCIFEICLKRGWAQLADKALDLCKIVDKRCWLSMSPLRQFSSIPEEAIKKLEKKYISFERMYDLNPHELGELVRVPKLGKTLHKSIKQFPKLDINANIQPITRSLLRVELTITPDFQFDEKIHGTGEGFWVIVHDVDGESILFHDYFILKKRYSEEEHNMTFFVPIFEPLPPNYFLKIVSDRWLHSETIMPISFKHLILPEKFVAPTELLDLQPLPVTALRNPKYEAIYKKQFQFFNPIQTQVFNTLYNSDANTLVAARTGCGKTVCAEFAVLRLISTKPRGRIVYVAPFKELVEERFLDWKNKFSSFGKTCVILTGETTADLKLMSEGEIVFATPKNWDMISRKWIQREAVQKVDLFIVDEIHMLGYQFGHTIEVIVSRMRYMSKELETQLRIVALSTSLATAKDLGEWIGATSTTIFNFSPSIRSIPLDIQIYGFNVPHFQSMMMSMTRPTYLAVSGIEQGKNALVFVPSRKQAKLTALDIITLCTADGKEDKFLQCQKEDIQPYLDVIEDESLKETLALGVGFYHENLTKAEKKAIETLFNAGAIQVVVASRDTCWAVNSMPAHLVVLMGTQYYDGKEHRYSDYPLTDILQMMGKACRPTIDENSKCVVLCTASKKDFYKKFIFEALPVESHLDQFLHDHFNAEIVNKTITNQQEAVDYLTWTFMYRRLSKNPNYYNLQGVTHNHISDHLSELVENTLKDLEESKCISIEEGVNLSAQDLGIISSYYYILYTTVELFSKSLNEKTKVKGLLEIISAASEFDDIPVRHHEDALLEKLHSRMPIKMGEKKFNDPHTKANILFQAHFSRTQLPSDVEDDQKQIVSKAFQLILACVDVISANGWLQPAIAAMELSQMMVQAMWNYEPTLKQIPHFTQEIIKRCTDRKIENVFDLTDMDPEDRKNLLQLGERELKDVARFCNRYPSLEVNYEFKNESLVSGETAIFIVNIEREDEEQAGPVIAPFYPQSKDEGWWVVLGDPTDNVLLGVKRLTVQKKQTVNLKVIPHKAGNRKYKLYVMCDSFVGCDQEYDIDVKVAQGEEDDEEEEEVQQQEQTNEQDKMQE